MLEYILAQKKIQNKTDSIFERGARLMIANYGHHSLFDRTDIILYHSINTVLIDKEGNPNKEIRGFDVCPSAESPILYPVHEHRVSMKRHMPPPSATYISLARDCGFSFRISLNEKKLSVEQTLFHMTGEFFFSEYGQSGTYPFQNEIQTWLRNNEPSFVAAVTAPSALQQKEVTYSVFKEMVPKLTEASIPFVVAEIITRTKNRKDNLPEYLMTIGREIIIDLLKDLIIDWVKWYLTKKIGSKIIPLINAVVTVAEIWTEEEERIQIRTTIACLRMAIKGGCPDDMTIAAKVFAKVIVDKFEDKLIEHLALKARQGANKLVGHSEAGTRDEPKAAQDKPPEESSIQIQTDPASLSQGITRSASQVGTRGSENKTVSGPDYTIESKPIGLMNMNSGRSERGLVREPAQADNSEDTRAIGATFTDKPVLHKQDSDDTNEMDSEATAKGSSKRPGASSSQLDPDLLVDPEATAKGSSKARRIVL